MADPDLERGSERAPTTKGTGASEEARRAGRLLRARPWLWRLYCASCFTYSLIGLAMLLDFNARIPAEYHELAPVSLHAYSLLLCLQGPASFGGDVVAPFVLHQPVLQSGWPHPLNLFDIALANTLSVLLMYMAVVFPHDAVQAAISVGVVSGPLSFGLARRHYERKQWVEHAVWKIVWHVSFPAVAWAWLAYTAEPPGGLQPSADLNSEAMEGVA